MPELGVPLLPHPLVGGAFASPVRPGTGWPGDPSGPATPVCRTPAEVAARAAGAADLAELGALVAVCAACPRLVGWREEVAVGKRAAYADQPYWGRPVPSYGDPVPRLLVVGHDLTPLRDPVDVATQTRMFDPGAYVGVEEIAAALGESDGWRIEVNETRPRPPGATSSRHVDDVVLRASKLAG